MRSFANNLAACATLGGRYCRTYPGISSRLSRPYSESHRTVRGRWVKTTLGPAAISISRSPHVPRLTATTRPALHISPLPAALLACKALGCGLWATFGKILILPKSDALTVFGLGPTMVP